MNQERVEPEEQKGKPRQETQAEEGSQTLDLTEFIDAEPARPESAGVVVGRIIGLNQNGHALVSFPSESQKEPLLARSTVPITQNHIGHSVTLQFEGADPRRPIVTGVIQEPKSYEETLAAARNVQVNIDGKRLILTAQDEIVLQCGKATIMLNRRGKVVVRGTNLISRSSGRNKIKGGSVQIN